jgi:hypothetical protein
VSGVQGEGEEMKIPRGIRNNNPGNLVLTNIPWRGKVPNKENTDRHFEQFRDTDGVKGIIWGIRAMMMDLKGDIVKDGLNTIRRLIEEYAPKHENNTEAYIARVSRMTGIGPNELLYPDQETMQRLVRAMAFVEHGGHWITLQQIEKAWGLL